MITELLCSFWSGKGWINSRYDKTKFRVYMVNIGFSLIAQLTVIFNVIINQVILFYYCYCLIRQKMWCLPKKIICNDQSGPFNVVWYCCYFSVQLRDREHQIRRMESEQEDLNKKLAVSKTEKFLMYISNTKYFLEQSVSKLLWILHSEN